MKMPTIYLPHGGGPCFFMDWTIGPKDTWSSLEKWLRRFPKLLPEPPKALVVISAHWEQNNVTVTSNPNPKLIYDYSGFPRSTYKLKWPSPGDPELSERIISLLSDNGISCSLDKKRGFDHGVFVPLKVAFPDTDIPTVQLSLVKGLDPGMHIDIGAALAPLREEGVLIIGSGMSYHNMKQFMTSGALQPSQLFNDWLERTMGEEQWERYASLTSWERAPSGRRCHPSEEHLLPLMVVVGAAGEDLGTNVFSDTVMGAVVSAFFFQEE
jgi:aromatic ring-opening dioxygenase catalytic subunit (LigB family)